MEVRDDTLFLVDRELLITDDTAWIARVRLRYCKAKRYTSGTRSANQLSHRFSQFSWFSDGIQPGNVGFASEQTLVHLLSSRSTESSLFMTFCYKDYNFETQ